MSRIRWYLDEDAMTRSLVRGLRARDIDVLTVFEAGTVGRDDQAQLEFAAAAERALFTFNVDDFCRLHSQYLSAGREHAGIVVAHRGRYTLGQQVRGLARLTTEVSAEEMWSGLLFLKV